MLFILNTAIAFALSTICTAKLGRCLTYLRLMCVCPRMDDLHVQEMPLRCVATVANGGIPSFKCMLLS